MPTKSKIMSVSNVAGAALISSALKNRDNNTKVKTFEEAVLNKPIAFALIAGAGLWLLSRTAKRIIVTQEERVQESAETETSFNNPWSWQAFLDWNRIKKIAPAAKTLTYAQAVQRANNIYSAMCSFSENEQLAISQITSLPTQLQVAQVCNAFESNKGISLLTTFKSGIDACFGVPFAGGLSAGDYNNLLMNVSKKPKF
jgi:hypothetical protein